MYQVVDVGRGCTHTHTLSLSLSLSLVRLIVTRERARRRAKPSKPEEGDLTLSSTAITEGRPPVRKVNDRLSLPLPDTT